MLYFSVISTAWWYIFRYKAELRRRQSGCLPRAQVVPQLVSATPGSFSKETSVRKLHRSGVSSRLPDYTVDQETIFLCRQVYDIKLRRILKNPPIHVSGSWKFICDHSQSYNFWLFSSVCRRCPALILSWNWVIWLCVEASSLWKLHAFSSCVKFLILLVSIGHDYTVLTVLVSYVRFRRNVI